MLPARRSLALAGLFAIVACAPATRTTTVAVAPRPVAPTLNLAPAEREALSAGLGDLVARLEDAPRARPAAYGAAGTTLAAVCLELWTSAEGGRLMPDSALLGALEAQSQRRIFPRSQCDGGPRQVVRLADASGGAAAAANAMLAPDGPTQELLVSGWRFSLPNEASFEAISWYERRGRRYHCEVERAESRAGAHWVADCRFQGLLLL